MLKIAHLDWNIAKLNKLVKQGQVTFDNPMQRGLVWSPEKKSRLIHSILEDYPIPPIYTEKSNNLYDVLDGKQRCTTITSYINNKFALKKETPVELSDGSMYDVTKKKFEELPEELQERIKGYSLTVYYLEDATFEQKREMFTRLNSGKPMSNIEMTKALTRSANEVTQMANHPIFNLIMNEKGINNSGNVGIVMQVYSILFNDSKCLLNTAIKSTLRTKEISSEEVNTILNVFSVYETILKKLGCTPYGVRSESISPIVAKIKRKTHFVSTIPVLEYAIKEDVSIDTFIEWLEMFFTSDIGATISEEYNKSLTDGTNTDASVKCRINATMDSFKEYVGK